MAITFALSLPLASVSLGHLCVRKCEFHSFFLPAAQGEHRLGVESDGVRAEFYAAEQTWPISTNLRGKNKVFRAWKVSLTRF